MLNASSDFYVAAIYIKKPVNEVFDYVSDIKKFHQWRIGDSTYLKQIDNNFWEIEIPEYNALFKKRSIMKVNSNSQKKTIDFFWGTNKENLFCYQPMRVISALEPLNREGSIVLWTGFKHPALDESLTDVLPAIAELSLMNLKKNIEKVESFDQNEKDNTDIVVAVGKYINAHIDYAFNYISNTNNLEEWTILCRDLEQVDKNIWCGMASGYGGSKLFYKTIVDAEAKLLTWHCGMKKEELNQFMPTMFYPAKHAVGKDGTFFIWVGFRNPNTPSRIFEYMKKIHTFEISSLKKVLENKWSSSNF